MKDDKKCEFQRSGNAEDIRTSALYRKVCEITDWCWIQCNKFRSELGDVADQLSRSIDSVGANLAEGYGRGILSEKTRRQFYAYSLGSAYEAAYWLDRAVSRHFISPSQSATIRGDLDWAIAELASLFEGIQ